MAIPEITISDRVHLLMRRHGDTVMDLADYIGVHRATLGRLLSGETEWKALPLHAISTRYDVPYTWLFLGETE